MPTSFPDNPDTLVAVCCYEGDSHRVRHALPLYEHHKCPVLILSPEDSKVTIEGCENRHAGKRAYIGEDSLTRQCEYLRILLTYPHEFFLLNDSDSFCVSAEIPRRLYYDSERTVWSNEVPEPRPHASPYPKFAMQPPYFFNRRSLERFLTVAHRISPHPVTMYVDWYMLALCCETGLVHRSFEELSHAGLEARPIIDDPWKMLDWSIRHEGATMMHPIKEPCQVSLCVEARKFYESSKVC